MMEITVSKNLLMSERDISKNVPRFRKDRQDVYMHFSDWESFEHFSFVLNYICVEVNCNPDFDW